VLLQCLQSLLIVALLCLAVALPVATLGADALRSGRSAGRVLRGGDGPAGPAFPCGSFWPVSPCSRWGCSRCWFTPGFQAGAYGCAGVGGNARRCRAAGALAGCSALSACVTLRLGERSTSDGSSSDYSFSSGSWHCRLGVAVLVWLVSLE